MTIRLGMIGVGNWAGRLATAVAALDGVELVACHSRTPHRRMAFAEKHGLRAVADLGHFAKLGTDGVIVATPHSTHADLVVALAELGLGIMVEKPLALNATDARRCIAAASQAQVTLQVAHYRRRHSATRGLKALIDDGSIGTVHLVEGHFSRRLDEDTARPWREDRNESPAGAMTALGVHMADNLLYLGGPIRRLSALSTRIGRSTPIDDMTGALMEFETGAIGKLTTSLRIPKLATTTVHGTQMTAWSEADGSRLFTLAGDHLDEVRTEQPVEVVDGVAENIASFVASLASGDAPETGGAEGLAVVEILEAMTTSAANNGAAVEIASLRP